MACDRFLPEDYGLFALGSLEGAEATEIATHLRDQCETCVREVRLSLSLWTAFGTALSPDVGIPTLRNIAAPVTELRPRPRRQPAAWRQWGTIAASLILLSGATAWVMSVLDLSARRALENQVTTLQQRSDQLTRERDNAARERAQTAAPAPVPVVSAPAALSVAESALRRNLTDVQTALDTARQSLSGAQSEISQLQGQLSQQQTEIASLRTQEATLESRATSAAQNATQSVRAVQQLQTRISELEAERTRLVNLIEIRQRQSQQNLQLVHDLATPGTRFIPLTGTESAPNARGYAVLTADNRLTFYQAGLPGLALGRTYQIWLIRDRGTPIVSGGLFNPGGTPQAELSLTPGNNVNNLTAIAVTSEPAGGSTLPTGQKLLVGTVRKG